MRGRTAAVPADASARGAAPRSGLLLKILLAVIAKPGRRQIWSKKNATQGAQFASGVAPAAKKSGTEVPPSVECSFSWKLECRGDGLSDRDAGGHHIPGRKANIA